ncbi:Adenosine monophosphate-protein transferase NmFic [Mycoplasmopsis agalactiae]|nr:Adenosine monophosphate-protein transferase NmFic [Mycoplasmopsis agalactiae]
MVRSCINTFELKDLLRKHLTDKVNDRTIYIKSIAKSYENEGYKIKFRLNIRYINEIGIKKCICGCFTAIKMHFLLACST